MQALVFGRMTHEGSLALPLHRPSPLHNAKECRTGSYDRAACSPPVRSLDIAEGPEPLHGVVEDVLQAIGVGVPDPEGAVLRSRQDDGQLWMEAGRADVVAVTLQGLHARLGLVVPDLHKLVVGSAYQVRAVACARGDAINR